MKETIVIHFGLNTSWLNSTYRVSWIGDVLKYYGFDGNPNYSGTNSWNSLNMFKNNPTLINLDQWNECVNGFILPEKYCLEHSEYTLITYEQFQKYVLKETNMIDYKVPGTPIPSFKGSRFKYRTVQDGFEFHKANDLNDIDKTHISHGWVNIDNEVLIKFDTSDYKGDNHFLVRESDLLSMTSNKTEMNNKKIIGYKLIKPEYAEAASKISEKRLAGIYGLLELDQFPDSIKAWKKAGVLDLWFEPVYESGEITIDMGGFELKIKDGKCYHGSEDISQYVKELVSFYNTEKTFAGYIARVEDITFSKTGCQAHKSNLKDWVKVFNELNK